MRESGADCVENIDLAMAAPSAFMYAAGISVVWVCTSGIPREPTAVCPAFGRTAGGRVAGR